MKKIIVFAAIAALSVSLLPLSACGKKQSKKISSYTLKASYDEESATLTATCGFDYYNSTGNRIDELEFNLWGNAYREGAASSPISDAYSAKAYYAGKNYGGMTVEKVDGCSGWEIGGEDMNILNVSLNSPLYPEQSAKVTISYSLQLAKVNHRTGVTPRTVNLGNFYPVLCAYSTEGFIKTTYSSYGDPFVSECADYDVTFTLPQGYVAAASGELKSESSTEGKQTARYTLTNARDFAAVLSKEFKTQSYSAAGCEVKAYYLDNLPESAVTAATESLNYFSGVFGAYPYKTYSLVFTPLTMSGMEYPALSMIDSSLTEDEGIYTAVHETAHQWWYAQVGNDQINYAFMDEGLAEYSSLLFFEKHPQYGFTRTGILGGAIKAYRAYYSVYNQIFGKCDTTMIRSLNDFASDYEYVNIAYNKSLVLFENLRAALGEEKFSEALKEYYRQNKFKIASFEEMESKFVSKGDVEGLIDGFVNGKAVI